MELSGCSSADWIPALDVFGLLIAKATLPIYLVYRLTINVVSLSVIRFNTMAGELISMCLFVGEFPSEGELAKQ